MFNNERLREIRKKRGITIKELASKFNLAENTYGQYESGKYVLPMKYLIPVCNLLNVSIDYLFDFSSKENYKDIRPEIDSSLTRERLIKIREKKELSQQEFAVSLGISKSAISIYESEKEPIPTATLYDICYKYNISADYLLGRIDKNFKIKIPYKKFISKRNVHY